MKVKGRVEKLSGEGVEKFFGGLRSFFGGGLRNFQGLALINFSGINIILEELNFFGRGDIFREGLEIF